MGNIGTIIIMGVLVMMSAYFSATETAFNSLNLTKLKISAEKGDRGAALMLRLVDDYNRLLTTILVGNNIVNIALSSIATVFFIKLVGDAGATVSTAVITVIVLIFGEITPKSIAKESPEAFARFSAPIINFLAVILTPINYIFSLWKKLISLIFKSSDEHAVTEEELLSMVEEVESSGGIGEQEGELIRNAMELNENDAADIATPRVDIEAVGKDWTKEEVAQVFVETGYSRLPVYIDSIDNIIGIIHRTDFYNNYDMENIADTMLTTPVFVPTTIKIGALLKLLQKNKCHMAVVTDEYGGTFGIVTMEDILEELVGEIWDEHDEVEEDISENKGIYTVSGSMDPEELFEELEMDIEEVPYATLSGWIMDELNKVPEEGDTFDSNGYRFTVETVDGMRVDTAVVEKIEPKTEAEEE
ncbi:MAG: HlyC/CorC family transporter [Oscillospiraceae bacterium]|nr:HlyC/CorC family transporter [Oscillospiraceae bacterium]MBQ3236743.1 HlyC/CorC family transporter [Oscillospiraceae bacterium]MBQ3561457.1 HlyC/CorC family transporter [Oscillospiraceae bacterium]MBQ4118610.1 HlyC/CorC family transporter [Oscillospiraceae bacterium]